MTLEVNYYNSSVQIVIPFVIVLKMFLQENERPKTRGNYSKIFRLSMMDSLIKHFENHEDNKNFVLASFLDPLYMNYAISSDRQGKTMAVRRYSTGGSYKKVKSGIEC